MNENKNNQNGGDKKNNRQPFYTLGILVLIALFFTSMMYRGASGNTNQEISYTEFTTLVEEEKVDEVEFKDGIIYITLKEGETYGLSDAEKNALQQIYETTGSSAHATTARRR